MEKQDIKTNPNLVDALGYYIKNRRLQKKIGLREMADKLNISPAYLSNLESGKHNICLLYIAPSTRDQRGTRMRAAA